MVRRQHKERQQKQQQGSRVPQMGVSEPPTLNTPRTTPRLGALLGRVSSSRRPHPAIRSILHTLQLAERLCLSLLIRVGTKS
ncbi:hypothetical protein J6590_026783 [Homalodisca vitripennis]|nr:hypothetical protein J6590_026783 [Homalodisca vitripennis]